MKRMILLVSVAILLIAAGCTTSGGNSGEISVEDVWGRNSPKVAQNGAFYMKITNNSGSDDELVAATSDACGTVELHEMYMKENDVMGMREVPGGKIPLPDGETVELKVGGLHVMCIEKEVAFEIGDKIPLTLDFANASDMELTVEIRESEMGGMDMEHKVEDNS
jgi:copper(I)-binding protein